MGDVRFCVLVLWCAVSVSLCVVLVLVLVCNVWCVVCVRGVCCVCAVWCVCVVCGAAWHAENPPCVGSKRLRV